MALGSVHVDRANSKVQMAETEKLINSAVADHNSAVNAHFDIRANIRAIELRLTTNVVKNPFSATFSSLDGLTAAGVWNADLARLEF